MNEEIRKLRLGLVYGFAAAVPVVVLSYPVLRPSWLLSPDLTLTLGFYVLSNLVYLPSEGFFHVDSLPGYASVFYSLPVVALVVTGYLTARSSDTGSAVSSVLHGSLAMTGYMVVFVAAFFVYYVESGITDTGPAEVVLLYILPVMVYTAVLGGIGGGLNRMVPRGDDAGFGVREAAHLGLAILLLSMIVVTGVALAPTEEVRPTSTVEVSLAADAEDETFSATVEEIGEVDSVYIVGDHALKSDPVLNDSGETVTLHHPRHLEENGSLVVVAVIGEVNVSSEAGIEVVADVEAGARETAIAEESWNFTFTR